MRKVCISVTFGVSALVYLIFAGVSLERASNAGRINSDFDFYGDGNAYDTCQVPGYFVRPEDAADSA